MRRIGLLTIVALFIVTDPASAQRLAVGVRGGLNVATADAAGAFLNGDAGSSTGFHVGGVFDVAVASNFGVQTQLLYSKKGLKDDGGTEVELTYVEIPILFTAKLPGKISPHLYGGTVLSLESGCSISSGAVQNADCDNVAGAPATKNADTGILLGGGVALDAGLGLLLLDVFYNVGLTDISEVSADVDSIKNRTWYLSGGFLLPLGS